MYIPTSNTFDPCPLSPPPTTSSSKHETNQHKETSIIPSSPHRWKTLSWPSSSNSWIFLTPSPHLLDEIEPTAACAQFPPCRAYRYAAGHKKRKGCTESLVWEGGGVSDEETQRAEQMSGRKWLCVRPWRWLPPLFLSFPLRYQRGPLPGQREKGENPRSS